MAIQTGTFLTFSAIGNREDLADTIYTISPTDTPFMANIDEVKAKAVLHEWQTDNLAAAASNAQVEGNDYTSFTAVTPTVREVNRAQISVKDVIVSGTQQIVDKAGRVKELVYQLKKKSDELKRDMEFVLTSNQAPVTGNSTTARQLRPLCGWYTSNVSRGAGGANGTSSAAATDGTQRPLTETLVKDVIQSAWTNGGNIDMILVGPSQKTTFSGFTGGTTKFNKSEEKKLVTTIDVYVSDFGEHKIMANRFQRSRDVHLLDTKRWAIAKLRPIETIDLAKTGDAEKAIIQCEYTLEARNQSASGIVADVS